MNSTNLLTVALVVFLLFGMIQDIMILRKIKKNKSSSKESELEANLQKYTHNGLIMSMVVEAGVSIMLLLSIFLNFPNQLSDLVVFAPLNIGYAIFLGICACVLHEMQKNEKKHENYDKESYHKMHVLKVIYIFASVLCTIMVISNRVSGFAVL